MENPHESISKQTLITQPRLSDSRYVEWVTHGLTFGEEMMTRPAENHWHMVFVKENGRSHAIVVGPWTTAGEVWMGDGAEILWIRFQLGTFMPHLPTRNILNTEISLPEGRCQSFYLKGSTWEMPTFENADTFLERLVREELLVCDPLVNAALQDQLPRQTSARTVRHRFLQATGLSQKHIQQMHRAQQAAELLRQGVPIVETALELGYYDQPHLTKSLKQFMGYTPAQMLGGEGD
jgi:AraC-like DNA-binding protein